MKQLKSVLERLRAAYLTAKPKKCRFGMEETLYLGHVIGGGHVKPELSKVQAVKNYPVPTNKSDIHSFLGLVGYYRKFIPNFASISDPLSDLTKKTVSKIVWTNEYEKSFNKLKEVICSEPVLRSPNHDKQMILQTDASNRGRGAVLSQVDDNGEEHPIVYISRKLLPREEQYSIVEKECLAIVWAVKTLNIYFWEEILFYRQITMHYIGWIVCKLKMRGWLAGVYICRVGNSKFSIKKEKKTGMQTVYPC